MKKIRAIVTAALAVAGLVLTGCGGNDQKQQDKQPDVAACKTAMKADYAKATSDPNAPSASRPPACQGVDDATLERLAGEVISESLGG